MLALQLGKKKAFSLIRELRHSPVTMYWWSRFDSQTELREEETVFSHSEVKSWLEHDAVLQGGELTSWPKLLDGDDLILHWIQEAKRMRKKIEGHFPGASEKTLAKMMLFGADCDHEAMTGEEVYDRLMQGYMVSLRHSSIRPDLPVLLDDMKRLGIDQYGSMFFNTDGSTPAFYENGILDMMIRMAIEKGIPVIDAYLMASYNVARYYNIDHLHGLITTGRVASINFLEDEKNPTPIAVLSKGKWLKKDGMVYVEDQDIEWKEYGFAPLELDWKLTYDDMQFSMPFGIEMINDVITKPYSVSFDVSADQLTTDHDESFMILIGRDGTWRMNTIVKGFSSHVMGFASSFSSTGDIILIGKNKNDMMFAFDRMKELGGGIVLTENGEVIHEIPLCLSGFMSDKEMNLLIKEEKKLKELLADRGYPHNDPIYSLLFFSATHLPYVRITQRGIYDVMNKTVLFPTIMR